MFANPWGPPAGTYLSGSLSFSASLIFASLARSEHGQRDGRCQRHLRQPGADQAVSAPWSPGGSSRGSPRRLRPLPRWQETAFPVLQVRLPQNSQILAKNVANL